MRKPGRSLFAALMAAHGTELEIAARRIVDRVVIANVTNARIASALCVTERHARRLMRRYGWARTQLGNRWSPPHRTMAPHERAAA